MGITARVLQDLGVSRSLEARIILGAAVVDDVLGLIILGTVSGAIIHAASGRAFAGAMVISTTASAAVFLFGAMVLGRMVIPRMFAAGALLKGRGVC